AAGARGGAAPRRARTPPGRPRAAGWAVPAGAPAPAPPRARHVVLAGLCLAVAIAYVHRNCVGVAEAEVRAGLRLSLDQSGLLMSSFFLTYALLQVPAGWLGSLWGPRRTLALVALVGAAAPGLGAGP